MTNEHLLVMSQHRSGNLNVISTFWCTFGAQENELLRRMLAHKTITIIVYIKFERFHLQPSDFNGLSNQETVPSDGTGLHLLCLTLFCGHVTKADKAAGCQSLASPAHSCTRVTSRLTTTALLIELFLGGV